MLEFPSCTGGGAGRPPRLRRRRPTRADRPSVYDSATEDTRSVLAPTVLCGHPSPLGTEPLVAGDRAAVGGRARGAAGPLDRGSPAPVDRPPDPAADRVGHRRLRVA